jgi:hypothetical protein
VHPLHGRDDRSAEGVELTHQSIVTNAAAAGDCARLVRGDRVCLPVSFARPFGSVIGVVASLGRGATVVVPAEHFDAEKTLAAIAAERCTALHGEPRMFGSMLRHPAVLRTDVSSLRAGIVTGAAVPVGLVPEIVARLHLPELTVAYGQTEATAVVTQTRTEDAIDLRATTVGRALPDIEVKIVDPTSGIEVATGTEGELCCRGYPVMRGYHESPDATAAKLGRNGWLRTGDLAVTDRFGYCTLTGRVGDFAPISNDPRARWTRAEENPGDRAAGMMTVSGDPSGVGIQIFIKPRRGVVVPNVTAVSGAPIAASASRCFAGGVRIMVFEGHELLEALRREDAADERGRARPARGIDAMARVRGVSEERRDRHVGRRPERAPKRNAFSEPRPPDSPGRAGCPPAGCGRGSLDPSARPTRTG